MKIISKYKDFYDSYGFILGKPDESITYVRTTEVIDDDNKQYKSIIKNFMIMDICIFMFMDLKKIMLHG